MEEVWIRILSQILWPCAGFFSSLKHSLSCSSQKVNDIYSPIFLFPESKRGKIGAEQICKPYHESIKIAIICRLLGITRERKVPCIWNPLDCIALLVLVAIYNLPISLISWNCQRTPNKLISIDNLLDPYFQWQYDILTITYDKY